MNPVRTCVGCRMRAARSTLLRVVAVDLVLIPDEHATMPGRGAWVHQTLGCVDTAIKRRAFVRALRVSGPLDTQTLTRHLQRNG